MLVAPSILSADFGKLGDEISSISKAGADLIHIDVMDGHFVPNMTIGPIVVEAVAKATSTPLDIHLMVEDNNFFVELFAKFKPKYISFHLESEKHPNRLAQKIKSLGISPAVVLNPSTPPALLEYLVEYLDMVLLMSVNPGFGGQKYIPDVVERVKELKEITAKKNPNCLIEVDGGVSNKNIDELKMAGVDIVVAGSYIFGSSDYQEAINSLKWV